MDAKKLNEAVRTILAGGVVICPTDTVYGLIADAANQKAVEEIYKIKKRPRTKPLAVFISSIKQAKELAEINKEQEKILKKHWPGKYTFILKSKFQNPNFKSISKSKPSSRAQVEGFQINVSKLAIGENNTIGLRIPRYKLIHSLIKKTGKPLAQTSANISGRPASTKIKEVLEQIKGMPAIDAGDLPKSKPSKVIDLTGEKEKVIRN